MSTPVFCRSMFLLFLLTLMCFGDAHKVLLVFPFPIRSMSIFGAGIAKHLSRAGHEVTFVTAYPVKNDSETKFRQIDVFESVQHLTGEDYLNITTIMESHEISLLDIQAYQEYSIIVAELIFQNDDLRKLLNDPNEKFDAVIADLFETEIYSGLSFLYDCPMIWSYSMGVQWSVLNLIVEPTNPSYTTDFLSINIPPLDFNQRLFELWTQINGYYIKEFITIPKTETLFRNIFEPFASQRGKVLPHYKTLMYNGSIIFANEHLASGNIPSLPQNFKLVAGQHIDSPTKPLPKDLQNLMDNAKEGAIYFSLGSVWKSKDIPKVVKEGLVKVFGELKQTVIWKYEDDDLEPLPENLHVMKWAPQPSILNHPNCKIFITHGGLLSSTEALHFGVPIIGIPIFLDQFINIRKASVAGYGIKVDLSYNLPETLKSAIETMLEDDRFSKKVKELSAIYHDRPIPPGNEIVHWVEHVIKTRGALHLRSPALYVPWYQKMYLDLLLLITIAIFIIIFVIKRAAVLPKKRINLVRKKRQ